VILPSESDPSGMIRSPNQNVDEAGEVERADLVKGFEYAKNKYIEIDTEELKALRLPTATTMPIKQFIKAEELSPGLSDRPYFVVPKDDIHAKALSIIRKALAQTTLGGNRSPLKAKTEGSHALLASVRG
jgi:DNA end-binding protein Ku